MDEPVKRGTKEWTVHETIAHLCALNGAGLDSITSTLRGEPNTFEGLETRYHLNSYNRKGIDDRLGMAVEALCAEFQRVHGEAAEIARALRPDQAKLALAMPIYNRPVQVMRSASL